MGQTEASIDLQGPLFFLFHLILKLDNSNYKIGMVETTTISTISQPTASSTIFSIKAKQDEDNSISVGIQFKNEESLLNEQVT